MSDLVQKVRGLLDNTTGIDIDERWKWEKRFLGIAREVSTWSKDRTKVGAVIVNPETRKVISTGYNGFPPGMKDLQERLDDRDVKLKFTVHAEVNAIVRAHRDVSGFDIYTYPTLMKPNNCPDCAKTIAAAGIKRVFYYEEENVAERWEKYASDTRTIYDEVGIEYKAVPVIKYTPMNIADLFDPGAWNDVPEETKAILSKAYKQMKS